MKRTRVYDQKLEPDVDTGEHRLVAYLVLRFGFSCTRDMVRFSKSLDRKFKNLAYDQVLEKCMFVSSASSSLSRYCRHDSSTNRVILKLQVLEARPGKWFHIYSMMATKIAVIPIQIVTTCVVGSDVHSQVNHIYNSTMVKNIQKDQYGRLMEYYVDHSHHTDDSYLFFIFARVIK